MILTRANMKAPIENSYWLKEGRLLAGEYPNTGAKIEAIIGAGVTTFVDLTRRKVEKLEPYEAHSGVQKYLSFPVKDVTTPSILRAKEILDAIDDAMQRGEAVYIHCRGGSGRTGVIAGCWMVRHGREQIDTLRTLVDLWGACPASRRWPSPNTAAQIKFILNWSIGK